MKKIMGLVLFAFAGFAFASEYTFTKQVNPSLLQSTLISNGYNVDHIHGNGLTYTIVFKNDETRNPQAIIDAHIYVDTAAKMEANKARMLVLARKWVKGTITNTEKDELIKRFIISSLILAELE